MRYEPCRLVEGPLLLEVHIKNYSDYGGSGASLNNFMLFSDYTASHSKKRKIFKSAFIFTR